MRFCLIIYGTNHRNSLSEDGYYATYFSIHEHQPSSVLHGSSLVNAASLKFNKQYARAAALAGNKMYLFPSVFDVIRTSVWYFNMLVQPYEERIRAYSTRMDTIQISYVLINA